MVLVVVVLVGALNLALMMEGGRIVDDVDDSMLEGS